MPMKSGLLVVLSGPAGSGKSTIAKRLVRLTPTIRRAVTATTRKPRPGEGDGVDYRFLSRDEFRRRVAADEFIEYTEFNGNYYGTPRRELAESVGAGGNVLLVIEVDGAESLKFFFPEAVFVFIIPPTPEALRQRLVGRGTESAADIERRLAIAKREMERIGEYDYLIINADPEAAALDLAAVIRTALRARIVGGELEKWSDGYFANWPATDAPAVGETPAGRE